MKFPALLFALATLGLCSNVGAATLTLDTPCPIGASELPPGFRGHSPTEIVRALNNFNSKRGEYETEAMYAARIKKKSASLPATLTNGPLCVTARYFDGEYTKYDPDTQTLWVYLFPVMPYQWSSGVTVDTGLEIYVSKQREKKTSYTGSNAFGVRARIAKTESWTTYLSFNFNKVKPKLKSMGAEVLAPIYVAIPIALSIPEAKAMDGEIRVAYVFKPREPFVKADEYYKSPELNSPTETENHKTVIVSTLLGFIVFDTRSGKVIKNIQLN
ncbi:MAG TPA: hypothetical protein VF264_00985 [Rhodanobacteraceae bacterium]